MKSTYSEENDNVHLTNWTNLPLSSNQKRLWIIYQQDKLNPAYNLSLTYHIKGEIDIEIFIKSINILFNWQHTIFSVFRSREGVPYIEIVRRPVNVEIIDYSSFPESEREKAIVSFAGQDKRKSFDIEKGPLYRLYLMQNNKCSYYFHATIHHLIFDAWSMRLFVSELNRIYTNINQGKVELSEPLKYQSYDFAAHERMSKHDEFKEEIIEYWKNNLKDCASELKFPYDHPRANSSSGLGGVERIQIPENITSKLKELASSENSSLFKTLLSALAVLLQKYSNENDINIGIPVSSRRTNKSQEEIFGLFVNTTVARLQINETSSFREHIKYTRDVANKAIKNSTVPFDKIVEIARPERRLSMNPLFQVALSWWSNIIVTMDLNGILGERVYIPKGVAPFDITFYLWEQGDSVEGEIEYNADLLKKETIVRLKQNFICLLENLIQNPDKPIESVSLITESEKNLILSYAGVRTSYPNNRTIVQLFEDKVRSYPDKNAIVFENKALTYQELNSRANQLAVVLRNYGVAKNAPVGILAEKSLEIIVGILGSLKAGGAYVPIDPDFPGQRINFIVKDAGCKVLLTQDKFKIVNIEGVNKISLDSAEAYKKEITNIENINSSKDLAYIMYTSGTKGTPKGSLINQQGVVRLVRNTNYIELKPEDRILMTSSIVFDAATFEIWGALLNGCTLYIVNKETLLDPDALGSEIKTNKITVMWLTSALFTNLSELRTDIFRPLRHLLVGGDILSAPHINKVRKDNPDLKVINGYGPTENTTFSTTHLIEKDFDHNIPIGKPISNSTAYIFDRHMNFQPLGVIGELYVGGDGVSLGYLNRDDLKLKCFLDHPSLSGERLYRTGDYARWLPDGNIEFHGRVDNQLKIRGFRVELEEIEAVISRIEGVIETVIKPIERNNKDINLGAFLNVSDTFEIDNKELDRRIKQKLPSYMVPVTYKLMRGFPRTINGKIDRKALIFDINEVKERKHLEDRNLTPTEKVIHRIWSEALITDDISVTDNFFDIGGNSLMAITLFSKIESALKFKSGLRIFFDNPRIKDLAQEINLIKHREKLSMTSSSKKKKPGKLLKGEI